MSAPTYLAFGQIIPKSIATYLPIASVELETIDQGDSWVLVLKESIRSLANGPHLLGLSTMNILMVNYHEHFAMSVSQTKEVSNLLYKPDWIFFHVPKNIGYE